MIKLEKQIKGASKMTMIKIKNDVYELKMKSKEAVIDVLQNESDYVEVVKETEKAICFSFVSGNQINNEWIPKSCLTSKKNQIEQYKKMGYIEQNQLGDRAKMFGITSEDLK